MRAWLSPRQWTLATQLTGCGVPGNTEFLSYQRHHRPAPEPTGSADLEAALLGQAESEAVERFFRGGEVLVPAREGHDVFVARDLEGDRETAAVISGKNRQRARALLHPGMRVFS
jgi:hypothetical protein